ncbi:MAG: GTPase ObgE [Candidatus Tectomicrobia bacterium]|nr:GTPase ObgE [Candidatus Tectomicrobia bacterium]
MFVDVAKVFVQGGKGGNGCVSFRREKFVPRGGPNGGDGGDGGDVVVVASPSLHTLLDFQYRSQFRARRGAHGEGSDRHGRSGDDCVIGVPCGTMVREAESGALVVDLTEAASRVIVARGGRGGRGNARFKSSTNRAPRQAEEGAGGEERWLLLELKLIAEVGLIGLPNAGKSTLLGRLSAARPKVASYPFTTLEPQLGVVRLSEERSCVMADLPGLIEGAHMGRGLGLQFLRHAERTRLLLHLVDLSAPPEEGTPWERYQRIQEELRSYSAQLAAKPQLVALTKLDALASTGPCAAVERDFAAAGIEVVGISAHSGEGLPELLQRLEAGLSQTSSMAAEPSADEEDAEFR